jgi:hypothetical protein
MPINQQFSMPIHRHFSLPLDKRQAAPIARGRQARLQDAQRRPEQDLAVETQANTAYEAFAAHSRDRLGRLVARKPKPYQPPVLPEGKVNFTDPDSRLV